MVISEVTVLIIKMWNNIYVSASKYSDETVGVMMMMGDDWKYPWYENNNDIINNIRWWLFVGAMTEAW